MSLNLINFPHRADSQFAGRRVGTLVIESVHRRTPANGVLSNSDYAAVLRHDNGDCAVVPYGRLVSALRTLSPDVGVRTLYNEARNSGQVTAAVSLPKVNGPVAAGTPIVVGGGFAGATTLAAPPVAPKAPVNTATEAARQAQLGTIINAETALDLMTALVKAARQDADVARVVKSLSALI